MRGLRSRPRGGAHGVKIFLYLLRQIVTSLLFGVGAVLVLAVPGIAVSTVHKIPNPDIGLLAGYLPVVFQTLAPYLLPLCFLLAVVATYGRLASDREWTAIQMAGFHPARILMPGLLVAVGLTGLTWWQRERAPWALVGWLFYLGTLVPAIGLVQVGNAALGAERGLPPVLRQPYRYRACCQTGGCRHGGAHAHDRAN